MPTPVLRKLGSTKNVCANFICAGTALCGFSRNSKGGDAKIYLVAVRRQLPCAMCMVAAPAECAAAPDNNLRYTNRTHFCKAARKMSGPMYIYNRDTHRTCDWNDMKKCQVPCTHRGGHMVLCGMQGDVHARCPAVESDHWGSGVNTACARGARR